MIEDVVVLETNIDDLDPRLWPHVIERLLAAGALDAWLTPITMKKGRPAHTLSALCTPETCEPVRGAIFAETSTLGVRESTMRRHVLDRRETSVVVDGQRVGVKLALDGETVTNRSVEWDDVVAAAAALARPAKQILAEATALASELRS